MDPLWCPRAGEYERVADGLARTHRGGQCPALPTSLCGLCSRLAGRLETLELECEREGCTLGGLCRRSLQPPEAARLLDGPLAGQVVRGLHLTGDEGEAPPPAGTLCVRHNEGAWHHYRRSSTDGYTYVGPCWDEGHDGPGRVLWNNPGRG